MKAEQAKKLADEALDRLAEALKQGNSATLTAYLAAMGRFHQYSFGNVLLILLQKPDATRVAGFNAWKNLKRFVRKGEKGIVIVAPMLIRRTEEGALGHAASNGREQEAEDRPILRFKAVHVFDLSQTDGEPLPEFARIAGDPRDHTARLKALVQEHGIALEYSDALGGAFGVSLGGTIKLRTGLAPAEEFSTLVHELAHELLHKRDGAQRPSKTVRETEAEAVAFVVSQAVGLETGTASADYIRLYEGDGETMSASLERIQKTAAAIITAVLREPEADEQARAT